MKMSHMLDLQCFMWLLVEIFLYDHMVINSSGERGALLL
jgi:hypothetical protein